MAALASLLLMTVAFGQQAADRLKSGLRNLEAREYEKALRDFRESDRLDPNQSATKFNIGVALVMLGRFTEAEDAYRLGLKISPNSADSLISLCKVLRINKKYSEALETCREAAKTSPNSTAASAALLDAMVAGRVAPDEVKAIIADALARFPNDQWILERAFSEAIRDGNGSYAAELLNRLIVSYPQKSVYYGLLAVVYLELAREGDAVAAARRALELDPKNPFSNYSMGSIFSELGAHLEAITAFSKVLESDPKLNDARYRRAISLDSFGQRPEAIKDMRFLVTAEPNDFRYNFLLGRLLADSDKFNEAVVFLKRAVELRPADFEARSALGIALGSAADYEKSVAVLEEANQMRPGNSVILMVLNATRARQQAVPRVAEAIEQSKARPDDLGLKIFVIRLLAYSGRIDEAEPYIQDAIKLAPNDIAMSQAIAIAYIEAGRPEKAMVLYQQQLKIKEDPATHLGLANVYQKSGQNEEAAKSFARVIELKPDSPGVMKLYADLLRNMGKRREALDMYKRSLGINPNNAPALFNAAMLSLRLNEVDAAKQYLENLRTIDPQLARKVEMVLTYKIVLT